jgi:hypothetical protein
VLVLLTHDCRRAPQVKKSDLVVTSCSSISFADTLVQNNGWGEIHHGDKNDPKLTYKMICLNPDATKEGTGQPPGWGVDGKISKQHLSNLLAQQIQEEKEDIQSLAPEAYINRVVLTDEDAKKLHDSHSQAGSSLTAFDSVLDGSYLGGFTEKIVCQLRCKGVINTASFNRARRDIVGDCSIILTENIEPNNRFRRIYLVQVLFIAVILFIPLLLQGCILRFAGRQDTRSRSSSPTR